MNNVSKQDRQVYIANFTLGVIWKSGTMTTLAEARAEALRGLNMIRELEGLEPWEDE